MVMRSVFVEDIGLVTSNSLGVTVKDTSAQSSPKQIRTRVLNTTVGQWMRAIDLTLSDYCPQGGSIEDEAERVTKVSLLLMLTRWYDEQDFCLLLDSSKLRLPKRAAETNRFELAKILDPPKLKAERKADSELEDEDAPPGSDGPDGLSLNLMIPPY